MGRLELFKQIVSKQYLKFFGVEFFCIILAVLIHFLCSKLVELSWAFNLFESGRSFIIGLILLIIISPIVVSVFPVISCYFIGKWVIKSKNIITSRKLFRSGVVYLGQLAVIIYILLSFILNRVESFTQMVGRKFTLEEFFTKNEEIVELYNSLGYRDRDLFFVVILFVIFFIIHFPTSFLLNKYWVFRDDNLEEVEYTTNLQKVNIIVLFTFRFFVMMVILLFIFNITIFFRSFNFGG